MTLRLCRECVRCTTQGCDATAYCDADLGPHPDPALCDDCQTGDTP